MWAADLHLPRLNTWQSTGSYSKVDSSLTAAKFLEVTNLLLENPNLNSTHLFRADILYDSAGDLKTPAEKESACDHIRNFADVLTGDGTERPCTLVEQPYLDDVRPDRLVVRRLIPRNPSVDQPLNQRCLIYHRSGDSYAVVYIPDVEDEASVPWYHPPVKVLAYLYEQIVSSGDTTSARLSLHFLPFDSPLDPISDRLNRTFISLLNTFIRLSKHAARHSSIDDGSNSLAAVSTAPSTIKDTIIPQHRVQNTYSVLKQRYASDLIARWIESTEPSKHVFEDLAIAAFLIELWKIMYTNHESPFPGFIDLACGNGVLVYILIQEGYHGHGFDARRRKTWDILSINGSLEEKICVPRPFLDILNVSVDQDLPCASVHDGIFSKDTFIISNHADELTPWTPLLATLSSPGSPLPFLAIPCCSHALSGPKKRYTTKDIDLSAPHPKDSTTPNGTNTRPHDSDDHEPQSSSGDLKTLRAAKQKSANHKDDKSMYACLTRKVIALAEEVGIETEMTLMRIPSTRNIGIVGGRRRVTAMNAQRATDLNSEAMKELSLRSKSDVRMEMQISETVSEQVQRIIGRECAATGGIEASARMWIERAMTLQKGKGRGKVNLGYKPET